MLADAQCIVVTAKGFPDSETIRALEILSRSRPTLKFAYIGDLDPSGLWIFLDYQRKLQVSLVFLGLLSSDLPKDWKKSSCGIPVRLNHLVVLFQLSKRDVALLRSLQCASAVIDQTDVTVKRELHFFRENHVKFELEYLHSLGENYLIDNWLMKKLLKEPF